MKPVLVALLFLNKMTKNKDMIFTLKNVDVLEVERKHFEPVVVEDETKIPEITLLSENNFFSFIDKTKLFCITMIDSVNQRKLIGQTCFWCHHPFETEPIGCPVKYHPRQVLKTCQSEITKEVYHLQQSAPEKDPLYDTVEMEKPCYETDGIFCSFNCCRAFISDNQHKPLYKNSTTLLEKLYRDIFQTSLEEGINPAPHWRMLKPYGGPLTIQEFRDSFLHYTYKDTNAHLTTHPNIIPQGKMYEQVFKAFK